MANKRIEALEKLIGLKDETIKELERQVLLLKNQPPIVITQPYSPGPHWQTQPWNPILNPPYIITSQTPSGSITFADGSTYTITNASGSNVVDFSKISRC